MNIQKVNISKINPAIYNARLDLKPGDPDYEKLKNSIDTFGYVDPIIWNEKTGNLVGGHQRFKILVAQGLKEIEASVVNLNFRISLLKKGNRASIPKLAIVLSARNPSKYVIFLRSLKLSIIPACALGHLRL